MQTSLHKKPGNNILTQVKETRLQLKKKQTIEELIKHQNIKDDAVVKNYLMFKSAAQWEG